MSTSVSYPGIQPRSQWASNNFGKLQNSQPGAPEIRLTQYQTNTRYGDAGPITPHSRTQLHHLQAITNQGTSRGSTVSYTMIWLQQPVADNLCICQPTRPRTSHTYKTTHIVCHKRRTHTAHIGGNSGAHSSVDRGECDAGTYRMFPTKGHFSKVRKHNKTTKYIETKTENQAK